jgi:hypothetical protein
MKARGYPVPHADLMQVATLIHADLSQAGFDARIVPIAPQYGGGLTVEVRRSVGILHRSTGQGAVLKAWLTSTPQGFTVQIGTDRVGDAAAGAVEWLLSTPALVTEGYAAFQQAQVDERIFRVVDHFVTQVSRVAINRAPAKVPNVGPCAMCSTPMPYGARFCPKCAHDSQIKIGAPGSIQAACPGCKGPVALDAVFCPHCGKKITAPPPEPAAAGAPATATTKPCVKCAFQLDADAMFCSACGSPQPKPPSATGQEEKSNPS